MLTRHGAYSSLGLRDMLKCHINGVQASTFLSTAHRGGKTVHVAASINAASCHPSQPTSDCTLLPGPTKPTSKSKASSPPQSHSRRRGPALSSRRARSCNNYLKHNHTAVHSQVLGAQETGDGSLLQLKTEAVALGAASFVQADGSPAAQVQHEDVSQASSKHTANTYHASTAIDQLQHWTGSSVSHQDAGNPQGHTPASLQHVSRHVCSQHLPTPNPSQNVGGACYAGSTLQDVVVDVARMNEALAVLEDAAASATAPLKPSAPQRPSVLDIPSAGTNHTSPGAACDSPPVWQHTRPYGGPTASQKEMEYSSAQLGLDKHELLNACWGESGGLHTETDQVESGFSRSYPRLKQNQRCSVFAAAVAEPPAITEYQRPAARPAYSPRSEIPGLHTNQQLPDSRPADGNDGLAQMPSPEGQVLRMLQNFRQTDCGTESGTGNCRTSAVQLESGLSGSSLWESLDAEHRLDSSPTFLQKRVVQQAVSGAADEEGAGTVRTPKECVQPDSRHQVMEDEICRWYGKARRLRREGEEEELKELAAIVEKAVPTLLHAVPQLPPNSAVYLLRTLSMLGVRSTILISSIADHTFSHLSSMSTHALTVLLTSLASLGCTVRPKSQQSRCTEPQSPLVQTAGQHTQSIHPLRYAEQHEPAARQRTTTVHNASMDLARLPIPGHLQNGKNHRPVHGMDVSGDYGPYQQLHVGGVTPSESPLAVVPAAAEHGSMPNESWAGRQRPSELGRQAVGRSLLNHSSHSSAHTRTPLTIMNGCSERQNVSTRHSLPDALHTELIHSKQAAHTANTDAFSANGYALNGAPFNKNGTLHSATNVSARNYVVLDGEMLSGHLPLSDMPKQLDEAQQPASYAPPATRTTMQTASQTSGTQATGSTIANGRVHHIQASSAPAGTSPTASGATRQGHELGRVSGGVSWQWWQEYEQAVWGCSSRLTGEQLAAVLWSACVMKAEVAEWWLQDMGVRVRHRFVSMRPGDVITCARSLHHLHWRPDRVWIREFYTQTRTKLSGMTSSELAAAVYLLATFTHTSPPVYQTPSSPSSSSSSSSLETEHPIFDSSVPPGGVTLGSPTLVPTTGLQQGDMNTAGAHEHGVMGVQPQQHELERVDISNVPTAAPPQCLVTGAVSQAAEGWRAGSSGRVVSVGGGWGVEGSRPPTRWRQEFVRFSRARMLEGMAPGDLAKLGWGVTRLGVQPGHNWCCAYMRQVNQLLPDMNALDQARCLYAVAILQPVAKLKPNLLQSCSWLQPDDHGIRSLPTGEQLVHIISTLRMPSQRTHTKDLNSSMKGTVLKGAALPGGVITSKFSTVDERRPSEAPSMRQSHAQPCTLQAVSAEDVRATVDAHAAVYTATQEASFQSLDAEAEGHNGGEPCVMGQAVTISPSAFPLQQSLGHTAGSHHCRSSAGSVRDAGDDTLSTRRRCLTTITGSVLQSIPPRDATHSLHGNCALGENTASIAKAVGREQAFRSSAADVLPASKLRYLQNFLNLPSHYRVVNRQLAARHARRGMKLAPAVLQSSARPLAEVAFPPETQSVQQEPAALSLEARE